MTGIGFETVQELGTEISEEWECSGMETGLGILWALQQEKGVVR